MTAFRSNVLQPCSIFPMRWHVKYFPFESWHQRGSTVQKGVTARTLLRVHFHPHPPHVPRQWGDGKTTQGCLSTCGNSGESCVDRRHACFHLRSSRDLLFQAPEEQEYPGIKVRGSLWWCEGCALWAGQDRTGRVAADMEEKLLGKGITFQRKSSLPKYSPLKGYWQQVGLICKCHTQLMGSSEP